MNSIMQDIFDYVMQFWNWLTNATWEEYLIMGGVVIALITITSYRKASRGAKKKL